ncbi:MAG: acyl-CoA dehydrogenase, partial [Mycobacterium sp.]|nr:acyl-CoA dehydrogenase [Mycobacterium sp.]
SGHLRRDTTHDLGDEDRSAVSVARGVTAHEGFLETRELSERYASRTVRDLSQLNFYLSLAAMKLGVILEGVHARFLAGSTVGEGYDSVASSVPLLTARGLRLLASDA